VSYVGTTPNTPRVLPTSTPGPVAPTPIDHAAGRAPRREQSTTEHRHDTEDPGAPVVPDPAIRIAGALAALFAGEIVEAVVEQAPAGFTAALRLPEARLLALRGNGGAAEAAVVQIRLVRSGDEPMLELLDAEGKARSPPVILTVRIEQSIGHAAPPPLPRVAPPAPSTPPEEAVLSGGGIVTLPAMMGRIAVHVPANAAYLHAASGLPQTIVAEPVVPPESRLVPPSVAADWETLWTAVAANPFAADRIRDQLQPREPARLAGGLLFLISVLRHGSLRHWLGDEAFSRLSTGSPASLQPAQSAFAELARQARDPGSEGWRIIPICLVDTAAIQPVMLYVHRPPRRRKTDPEPAESATRFMIDLVLSAAGPLRIDGLLRKRLLDLIIRTERVVPRVVSAELRALYADALAASGMSGRLEFQAVPRLPPAPVSRPAGPGAAVTA